jgi:hypothetical protein
MSDQSPHLSYRVLPNGKGWYWELLDSENVVIERGFAGERVGARAAAFEAACDGLTTTSRPYPEGAKRWPDTSSI